MTTIFKEATIDEACNVEYGTRVVRKKDAGTVYPVYGGGGETFFLDTFNRENRVVISRFAMSEKCTRRVAGKFALNDSGLTISPRDQSIIRQDFLDYYALSLNDQIYACARGTAQKNLDVPAFRQMKIIYPESLDKQQEIVKKLDSAFAEIDLLEGNLGLGDEKTNQLLQSLLSSAFSSTKGQNEFTKLFTVIPDSKSKVKSSSYLESGKYAVVDQGKELVAGYTDTSPTVDEKSLPVVVFGDHTRSVKYVDFPFTAGADGTQILKPSALTNPKYGFYLVLHAVGQIPSKGYARHFGELKKMQFQLPSLGEQRKIVEKLDRAFGEIDILKARANIKKDYATALRKSLLNSVFTLDEAVV